METSVHTEFTRLWLDAESRVRSVIRKSGGRAEEDDIFQETAIKAFRAFDTFDQDLATFVTWAGTIARNACIDRYRIRRRMRSVSLDVPFGDDSDFALIDVLETREENAQQSMERRELRETALRGMRCLPDKYRVPMEMRALGGLRYDDIARRLNLPVGTLKAHLYRGRKRMNAMRENGTLPLGTKTYSESDTPPQEETSWLTAPEIEEKYGVGKMAVASAGRWGHVTVKKRNANEGGNLYADDVRLQAWLQSQDIQPADVHSGDGQTPANEIADEPALHVPEPPEAALPETAKAESKEPPRTPIPHRRTHAAEAVFAYTIDAAEQLRAELSDLMEVAHLLADRYGLSLPDWVE